MVTRGGVEGTRLKAKNTTKFEAKDIPSRGQGLGPRKQAQVTSKKKSSKIFFKRSQKKLFKIFFQAKKVFKNFFSGLRKTLFSGLNKTKRLEENA